MGRNGKVALGVLGLAASALAAFVYVSSAELPAARAQGVDWQPLSVDEALARARAENRRVLVKFEAEWCGPCRQLDREVLETPEGGELTREVIAVKLDFDAPANRPMVERFVVLGLPTALVLGPDGAEMARIQGYEGHDPWITALRDGLAAEDPIPALRAARDAAPDDPVATLRLGEALLVRGQSDEGQALLERVTWIAGDTHDVAAEALFLLGRYHHRVRRDPATARHVWRELAGRYPESDWAAGAYYWYARAQVELGQPSLGLEVLRRRAEAAPDDPGPTSEWADTIVEHHLAEDRQEALAAVRRLLETAPEDARPDLAELAEKLSAPPAAAAEASGG